MSTLPVCFFRGVILNGHLKQYKRCVYCTAGGLPMKLTNLKYVQGLVVLVAALFMISCSSSDHDPPVAQQPTMNIVEIAIDDGNFTTLVAALQAADLDDDLAGPGPFTVFAPTDDAFALLPAGTLTFLLDPANKATLIDILSYHVIDGQVSSSDALNLDGKSAVMLNALNVRIDVDNGALILNLNGNRQATVTVTDIAATNGVIHVIDAVLDQTLTANQ